MNCALDPPRVHVMVVWVTARFWSAAVPFDKRAKRLRGSPPIVLKSPPTRILPSAPTATELTVVLPAFGLNESADPVIGSSRARRLRVCPPMIVKLPPATIRPSACTAIVRNLTVRVRIKRISQSRSGIESGDAVARLSADAGENAATR